MILIIVLILAFVLYTVLNIVGTGVVQELIFNVQDHVYNMGSFQKFVLICFVILAVYILWVRLTED